MADPTKDFEELLRFFGSRGAKVVNVGAHAVAYHAKSRYQLGFPPNRIDLMTSIDGVEFAEVWKGRVEGKYGQARTAVCSQLIRIANPDTVTYEDTFTFTRYIGVLRVCQPSETRHRLGARRQDPRVAGSGRCREG